MHEQPSDIHEALLQYTHTKIELAKLMREGMGYSEFIAYEEKLDHIDRILKREEKRLEQMLSHQTQLNRTNQ